MQNVFGECRIYRFLLPWKIPPFCAGPTIYNRILQRILLMGLLRLRIVLKNVNINIYHINIFICLWVTPSWWMHLYKSCLCHRNQQNIKSKILLEQFFFIDQDTYWAQPNGCLNSDMFYLDKLLLVEKGNIVLAKSICRSIEYSHRVITRNEFKMSCKLATAF